MSLPNPYAMYATELHSFRGYWRNNSFVVVVVVVGIIIIIIIWGVLKAHWYIKWVTQNLAFKIINLCLHNLYSSGTNNSDFVE